MTLAICILTGCSSYDHGNADDSKAKKQTKVEQQALMISEMKVEIKRLQKAIENKNIENDYLKNENGSLKAGKKRLEFQLEKLKELYVKKKK